MRKNVSYSIFAAIRNTKDVIFTWMDAAKWGTWMKSMYGIKVSELPAVVVADHQVSPHFPNVIFKLITVTIEISLLGH